jgi:hypothetical protein
MIDQQKVEKLNQLADRLTSSAEPPFVGRDDPPFDVSRPNPHKSKMSCCRFRGQQVKLA